MLSDSWTTVNLNENGSLFLKITFIENNQNIEKGYLLVFESVIHFKQGSERMKDRKFKFVAKPDGTHVREVVVEKPNKKPAQTLEIPKVPVRTPSEKLLSEEFPELISLPKFPDPAMCLAYATATASAVPTPSTNTVHQYPQIIEPEKSDSEAKPSTPRQRSKTAPEYAVNWGSIDESMIELPAVIPAGRHRQRFYTHAYDVEGARLNFAKEV